MKDMKGPATTELEQRLRQALRQLIIVALAAPPRRHVADRRKFGDAILAAYAVMPTRTVPFVEGVQPKEQAQ